MGERDVVKFRSAQGGEDDQLRRLKAEAERLASLSELDRAFQLRQPKLAEALGVPAATTRAMVAAILKERDDSEKAERREQARRDKAQAAEAAAEGRRQKQAAHLASLPAPSKPPSM